MNGAVNAAMGAMASLRRPVLRIGLCFRDQLPQLRRQQRDVQRQRAARREPRVHGPAEEDLREKVEGSAAGFGQRGPNGDGDRGLSDVTQVIT